MTTQRLSRAATTRLAAAPMPDQRYGLSVFLRKALPDARTVQTSAPPRLTVDGTSAFAESLSSLDTPLADLVCQRLSVDTPLALHVLRGDGATVIDIPERVERTVTLHDLLTPGAFTALHVRVGRAARLTLQEDSMPSGTAYGSALVLLDVEDGGEVAWSAALSDAAGPAVITRLARLGGGAVLRLHAALASCGSVRESVHVTLAGEDARTDVRSLVVAGADNQYDLAATAEHQAPRTRADLRTKVIASGTSQTVHRGLIRVNASAPQSDGYERFDALLLSPKAEVDPVPNLEINTDDVRCTHGVTVSHLNQEHLFYTRSRGVSEATAHKLLIGGFVGEMLSAFPQQFQGRLLSLVQRVAGIHS
jgi:Fe-S cluster assembly scaffold protein SufB